MRHGNINPAALEELQRLVEETKRNQLRLLRRVYAVFWGLFVAAATMVFLASPLLAPEALDVIAGPVELGLIAASIVLSILGIVLVRLLLLSPGRVVKGGVRLLRRWQIPDSIPLPVARRTVFLGRYSAGMLVGWVCAIAPALYGLFARVLGFGPWVAASCMSLSALLLGLFLPSEKRLSAALESLADTVHKHPDDEKRAPTPKE